MYRFSLGAGDDGAVASSATTASTAPDPARAPATNSPEEALRPAWRRRARDFTISTERCGRGHRQRDGEDPARPVPSRSAEASAPRPLAPARQSAASDGATAFGVYLSQGTDNPVGGLVCILDGADDCTGTENPAPGASYDWISILAVDDPDRCPRSPRASTAS